MIKRYCDRCGQQIDEGVHAWYVLELHGTGGEFRHKELCEECYEYLCEKDEVPKADRKTEPSDDWICNTCKYHTIERAVQCKMCGDGGQYEPKQTENCSEIPNNCEYAENPSGDVWECGCFLDTYCEHQIYDWNPDGTINIVECGYEPKTEPQTERSDDAE